MKKLLLITVLVSSPAMAGKTNDVRFPFIANGGFSGLCDRLGHDWGFDTALNGGFGSYACYSVRYQKLNRINTFIKDTD